MKADEIDKRILQMLVKDGRMSSAEIVRLVNAPEQTVSLNGRATLQQP